MGGEQGIEHLGEEIVDLFRLGSIAPVGTKAASRSSPRIRSSRSLATPSAFMRAAAAWLCLRTRSCSSCRLCPAFTPVINTSSVAMNASSSSMFARITAGWTTMPETTSTTRLSTASVARKASVITSLRLALSSSVRSNHWFACVCNGLAASEWTKRARLQIRSDRIGLRL